MTSTTLLVQDGGSLAETSSVLIPPPSFSPTGDRDASGQQLASGENAPMHHGSTRVRVRGRVVALTGATSFLGRNLVGVLEEDQHTERIVAIDVKAPETSGAKT